MSDFNIGQFPTTRLRRLRMKEFSRKMISENNLSVNDLIWPFLSFKRAGADGILTYFAKEIAEELNNE